MFNFILVYSIEYQHAEKFDDSELALHYIFLCVAVGIGESFLVNVITEYLERILKYPGENLDHPSALVTA